MSSSATDIRRTALLHTLRRCALFSDLSSEVLETIAEACEIKGVPKGTWLFREGERSPGFYIVHTGAINVHRVSEEGKEQVIRIFYPAESFAEVALASDTSFPADAMAIEDSQVVLVRREPFKERIHRDPDLALRILASMSIHLKYLIQMLEDLKFKHAEARLAHWLYRQGQANRKGGDSAEVSIELPMTKRLLASQLGIASETLSRVLAKFREDQAVTVEGKRIIIHSPDRLLTYIEGS